jgi:hypothetical protein
VERTVLVVEIAHRIPKPRGPRRVATVVVHRLCADTLR